MARTKKPTGLMGDDERRVLAFLWLHQGCTVGEVKQHVPEPRALALLRRLRARGYARQLRRRWSLIPSVRELVAIGSRIRGAGMDAFRLEAGAEGTS